MEEDAYPEIFEIRKILNKRANPKNGKIEYLVQWKLWPNDPTWEPVKNIRVYLKEHGMFKQDEDQCKQQKKQILEQSGKRKEQQERIESLLLNTQQNEYDSDQELNQDIQSLQNKYQLQILDSEQELKVESDNKQDFLYFDASDNEDDENDQSNKKDLQIIYKILDKKTQDNQIFYLVLFYDSKDPQWILKDNMMNYENDIEEYEQDLLKKKQKSSSDNNSKSLNFIVKKQSQQQDQDHESTVNSTPSASDKKIHKYISLKNNQNPFQTNVANSGINTGNLLIDKIESIEAEVKLCYKINWKPRKDGKTREPILVRFDKKNEVSPQELIDQVMLVNFAQKIENPQNQ